MKTKPKATLTSTILNSFGCANDSRSAFWTACAGFVSFVKRVGSNRAFKALGYTS